MKIKFSNSFPGENEGNSGGKSKCEADEQISGETEVIWQTTRGVGVAGRCSTVTIATSVRWSV